MTRRFIGTCFSVLVLSTSIAFGALQYRFEPGKNWKRKTIGYVRGWIAKDGSKATIVINTDTSKVGNYNISKKSIPKMIRYLEEVKKYQGKAFNITHWKIKNHTFKKMHKGKGSVLKLEGEYKGITGAKTRFIEWHYYIGKRFYQITYTQNAGRRKWSKRKVESILNKFKPKGA